MDEWLDLDCILVDMNSDCRDNIREQFDFMAQQSHDIYWKLRGCLEFKLHPYIIDDELNAGINNEHLKHIKQH